MSHSCRALSSSHQTTPIARANTTQGNLAPIFKTFRFSQRINQGYQLQLAINFKFDLLPLILADRSAVNSKVLICMYNIMVTSHFTWSKATTHLIHYNKLHVSWFWTIVEVENFVITCPLRCNGNGRKLGTYDTYIRPYFDTCLNFVIKKNSARYQDGPMYFKTWLIV